jgi:hypothetical protein
MQPTCCWCAKLTWHLLIAIGEQLNQRKNVVMEILTTERDYVAYLNSTLQVYIKPLELAAENKATTILTPLEIESIFMNLEHLYITNVALLKLLEHRIAQSWSDEQVLGDIFIKVVCALAILVDVSNQPTNQPTNQPMCIL